MKEKIHSFNIFNKNGLQRTLLSRRNFLKNIIRANPPSAGVVEPSARRSPLLIRVNLLTLLITMILFLFVPIVKAENLESDSYKIQMGNLNMGAGMPFSNSYKMGITGGQIAPGPYASTGYLARLGFWYIKTILPFSFSISDTSIDFGTLTAGTPSTANNILVISAGGAGGYQVTASESAMLTTENGTSTIADTTCDGGINTCLISSSKTWTDNKKYGFGYNLRGNDVPADFTDSTYFRPFPRASSTVVMSSSSVGSHREAVVTYKVNVGGSQSAGNYENYIIYIATPTY